ncbi:pentapeptide repeat-containing protein [Streptomyces sp. NPDC055287]
MLLAALVWGPWYFEGRHVRDSELAPSAGLIVTGFRTMLVALAVGTVGALGLYYTGKNHRLARKQFSQTQDQFRLAQEQFEHAQDQFRHTQARDREQAELTREAQVADRYVEAIKILSSDNITQRLGGIYSLERIMRDSSKDRRTVLEVLSAFIRDPPRPKREEEAEKERVKSGDPWTEPPDITVDVQAALTVIARRDYAEQSDSIDLTASSLRRAGLQRARFAGISLQGADLCLARGEQADLAGADLRDAVMRGAQMRGAVLRKANLAGADLRNADLAHADLTETVLAGARLEGVAGLNAGRLVKSLIDSSTELPENLASDSGVQARIAKLEKGRSVPRSAS